MLPTAQNGWAVFSGDTPIITTVSPTRTAAIINFLVTEWRIMVLQSATSDQIEQAWQDHKRDFDVHEVTVARKAVLQ
ncbi:MAG: hypothetical protein ABL936_19125 [Aestuariivirga sp.]